MLIANYGVNHIVNRASRSRSVETDSVGFGSLVRGGYIGEF